MWIKFAGSVQHFFEHFVLWSCHSMHQYKEPRAVATPHQVVRDLNANVSEFLPGSFIPKVPECARMTDVSSYLACGKLFTPIHIHIHICIYASLTSYVLKLFWTNFNVKGLTWYGQFWMYTHIFFGLTNLPYTLAYHALLINFMAARKRENPARTQTRKSVCGLRPLDY